MLTNFLGIDFCKTTLKTLCVRYIGFTSVGLGLWQAAKLPRWFNLAFMPTYREINESFDSLEDMGAEIVRYRGTSLIRIISPP